MINTKELIAYLQTLPEDTHILLEDSTGEISNYLADYQSLQYFTREDNEHVLMLTNYRED